MHKISMRAGYALCSQSLWGLSRGLFAMMMKERQAVELLRQTAY